SHVLKDKLFGRVEAAVKINGCHERLVHVRQQTGGHHGVEVHSLAQEEKIAEVEKPANVSAGAAADHHRFDLGEIAFLIVGKTQEELFAGDQTQDGVAQEFEPLVRS